MPDIMQDPAEVAAERAALQRENRILRANFQEILATVEAMQEYLDTPLGTKAEPAPFIRLVDYTMQKFKPI
jgi:hypothetical protein